MKNNTLNERFRTFLFKKKIDKPVELAKRLGYLSSEKLSRLFRNSELNPSTEILMDLAKVFPELNFNWLLTGEGDMLLSEQLPTTDKPVTKPVQPAAQNNIIEHLKAEIEKKDEEIKTLNRSIGRLESLLESKK